MDITGEAAGSFIEAVAIRETSHSQSHRGASHATCCVFAFQYQLSGKAELNITQDANIHTLCARLATHTYKHTVHLAKAGRKEHLLESVNTSSEKPVLSLRKVALLLQIGAILLSFFFFLFFWGAKYKNETRCQSGPRGLGRGRWRETESLKNASNAGSLFKHIGCCSQLDLWRKRWISTHLSTNKVRWSGGGEIHEGEKTFFFLFPGCDGWFQPKVLSLPVKKISTVILINKCLDLAFATLMLERKKFKLHRFFFSVVLRRLGQSSCHSCIKKRNLTLGHYFPLFVWVFFNYEGKTGTPTEADLRITTGKLRMA